MKFLIKSDQDSDLKVVRKFARQILEKEVLSNLFLLSSLDLKDFDIFLE